jgi:hypothetical protein
MLESEFLDRCKELVQSRTEIYIQWCVGGICGNSCWERTPEPREVEPEPEFEELYTLLEAFCPQITFLQTRSLLKTQVLTTTSNYDDYYGNESRYVKKTVDLKKLYQYLQEHNLLREPAE